MTEPFDGFLLIDKPAQITSFDCIRYIKKLVPKKVKISHMGTLDPFATGLMILGLGGATKKSGAFLTLDKEYIAQAKVGILTDTLDLTGEIIKEGPMLNKKEIEESIKSFGDKYLQTPPIYSALKFKGERLYNLARKKQLPEETLNQIVAEKTREIKIYNLSLLDYNEPFFSIKAHTSHGTYIRSLVNDIAARAGSYATTFQLRRTNIGSFPVSDAIELYSLKSDQDVASKLIDLPVDRNILL